MLYGFYFETYFIEFPGHLFVIQLKKKFLNVLSKTLMNAETKVHVPTIAQILREVLSVDVLLDTDFRTTEYLVKVKTCPSAFLQYPHLIFKHLDILNLKQFRI